ncbi:MAG: response regulator [Candidatus Hydrogenedens sp.]|nr:response regulator [Candidatus Hydrogenedens sp.]
MSDKPSVLIVDDEPENVAILLETLKDQYRVTAAVTGRQAIDLAEASIPDCILLDIQLPDLDGYEVCRQLKAKQEFQDVPIVFVSVLDETTDIVRGFQCGAVDYVPKPIEPEEVRARVRTQVRLRRVQQEYLEAKLRAEQAVAAKNHFLACISHELRTPLQVVLGTADLMSVTQPEAGSPRYAEYLARLEASGKHLLALVNDVLDITQIDANAFELERGRFSVDELVAPVLSMMDSLFLNKQLNVTCRIGRGLPEVEGDLRKCRQVLLNLLSNAVKYTPAGGEISVSAQPSDGGGFMVLVQDSGVGVPKDAQSRLFSDYAQVDRLRDTDMGGKGLGLALSRRLVELHGGKIGLNSAPGEGSCFWFTLPAPEQPAKPSVPEDVTPESGSVSLECLAGKCALVIEDDLMAGQTLSDMLISAGMQVTIARNVGDACRFHSDQRFDVILTDLHMPGISGPGIIDYLRKHFQPDCPPIVVTSSHSDRYTVRECREKDVCDFLVKPIRRECFLPRLALLLN